ncbi:MAG: methionyl-tRNA formyltransferase [SAR202 cluster bacterium]|nr:methionyl-tRNA formyltransferase [SAR202 cluster bacterium]
MGTPEISKVYLQSLIDHQYNIIATYTQPPRKQGRGMQVQKSPVHPLSLEHNIPVYHPENFASLESIDELKKLKPDLVVVMGYGLLFPKSILQIPLHGCINIHISLLPRWRGAAPIEHAILNGDEKTGVSIFLIEEKLDAGPIIATQEIYIKKNINKKDLTSELNTLGTALLINTLPDLLDNKISAQKQDETNATYAKKITPELRRINFNNEVNTVYNQIRAFTPKPSAWFIVNNERFNIIRCSMKICEAEASTIMNSQFHIGCKNGIIIPEIIQREGKKSMTIEEFLKGFIFDAGQKVNG